VATTAVTAAAAAAVLPIAACTCACQNTRFGMNGLGHRMWDTQAPDWVLLHPAFLNLMA